MEHLAQNAFMPQVVNDHHPVPEYLFSYLQMDKALSYQSQGSASSACNGSITWY